MKIADLLTPILDVAEIVVPGPLGKIIADIQGAITGAKAVTAAAAPLGTAVPAIGTILSEAAPIISGIEALLASLAHPASTTSGTPGADALTTALAEIWPLFPTLEAAIPITALPVLVPALENGLAIVGLFKTTASAATIVASVPPTTTQMVIPPAAAVARVTSVPVASPPKVTAPVPVADKDRHDPPTPMPQKGSVPVQSVTPNLPPVDPTSTSEQGSGGGPL